MALGVDEKTAYEDACKIEHDISEVSFQCMKNHFYSKIDFSHEDKLEKEE